ncbi:MAG: hypothetical protein OEM15_12380 [Myxococcales bacterium]|nr:hypothetical protein [Myxococcales bacterium]MDH3484770.1 hypothetical protein [Myxococcales bacterium]
MSVLRLLFIALFAVWAGTAGCGEETLPGRNAELCEDEFEPTLVCLAFCETSVAQCQFFPIPTVEECVQVCECQLAGGRAISDECENALANEFACGAELDCPAFIDFVRRLPPSDFPCMAEAAEVDAQCGTT